MIFKLNLLTLLSFGLISAGFPSDKQYYEESNRIVGGMPAMKGTAPHMVALVSMSNNFIFLICGGSILSTRHVLTAAHCIDAGIISPGILARTYRGVVGSKNYTSSENTISFIGYINHPEWNSFTIKNDIGVLFVREAIKMTQSVSTIPIGRKWIGGGEKSFVTGWGRDVWNEIPDLLQFLEVTTISSQECVDAVAAASIDWGSRPPPVDPRIEVCTYHSPGHGMCHGDSGSALVRKWSREQIGIVSWGFPCAVGAPDMFVRVSAYSDWLDRIVRMR